MKKTTVPSNGSATQTSFPIAGQDHAHAQLSSDSLPAAGLCTRLTSTTNRNDAERRQLINSNRVMAGCTIGLLAFSGMQWWTSEKQADTSKKQWSVMAKGQETQEELLGYYADEIASLKESLTYQKAQSKATEEQLAIARETLEQVRLQRRPWVSHAQSPTMVAPIAAGKRLDVTVRLKNSGTSPASCKYHMVLTLLDKGEINKSLGRHIRDSWQAVRRNDYAESLVPGIARTVYCDHRALSQQEIEQLALGTKQLLLVTVCEYTSPLDGGDYAMEAVFAYDMERRMFLILSDHDRDDVPREERTAPLQEVNISRSE